MATRFKLLLRHRNKLYYRRSFCSNTSTSFGSLHLNDTELTKEKSKVAIISHLSCSFHENDKINNEEHDEKPDRIKIVNEALSKSDIAEDKLLFFDNPTQITSSRITMAHSQSYVDDILDKAEEAAEKDKFFKLDEDTHISPRSQQSIMYAPACVCYAVDLILNNNQKSDEIIKRAFCNIRPPGHHAEYDKAFGSCIFNNIFIGAKYAQSLFSQLRDEHNAKIAIIDFDVHHGNGTQWLGWNDHNILYISIHGIEFGEDGSFFPGTGSKNECGAFDNVLNCPLSAGANGKDVKQAFNEEILPKLNGFAPDLVMISAGFNAHKDDSSGILEFTEEDYEWMTEQIVGVANEHCDGRIVSVLEGGYNLDSLKRSVLAHVAGLCE